MVPKKHVESIAQRYAESDKEYVLASLRGAIDRIGKAFPRYGSFLMEFIQNADDEGASRISIRFTGDMVVIANDGEPFSKADVDSLCKVGVSSKSPQTSIGYLGVGFKSIFLISDCPEVYSRSYRFKFSRSYWGEGDEYPWQVMPIWIEESMALVNEMNTQFKIPLLEGTHIDELVKELSPDNLNSRILLFLRNLTQIHIIDEVTGSERIFTKVVESSTGRHELVVITESVSGIMSTSRWLLFRLVANVPEEVRNDQMTKDWERGLVLKREIIVAFRLGDDGGLQAELKGTAHIGVFSFLPLKDIPSGLNYLLQADFLTMAGRGELARGKCLWNEWLADELLFLIKNRCIPALSTHEKWRMNFTDILISGEGGHDLFDKHIKDPLREHLKTTPCMVSCYGTMVKPEDAIEVDPNMRDIFTNEQLHKIVPNRVPLHQNCVVPSQLRPLVTRCVSYTAISGMDEHIVEMLVEEARGLNVNLFLKLYRKLDSSYSEQTLRRGRLRNDRTILTVDGRLVTPSEAVIAPPDLPKDVCKGLNIVHPYLLTDEQAISFFNKVQVRRLEREEAESAFTSLSIPDIVGKWPSLGDEERERWVESFKRLFDRNGLDVTTLQDITLPTKSGAWKKPHDIAFSSEYQPDHDIERIVKNGLLDDDLFFISSTFVNTVGATDLSSWKRFFQALGVDSLDDNKRNGIVQRVAVLTALEYEKQRGWEAHERTESEQKIGYDIDSVFGNEKRCIEVKGSSSVKPDITLTANEFRALRDSGKDYYVYIVSNALKNPLLVEVPSEYLIGETNIRVIVPFKTWFIPRKLNRFSPIHDIR